MKHGSRERGGRRRRLIYNNDGGDVTRSDALDLPNPEAFLDVRTSPLAGSHVDTISYCTSRGFGLFTHSTSLGTVLPRTVGEFTANTLHALLDRGTDPLRVVVEFTHANGMDVFWSMRMNDTHDGGRYPEFFHANAFKTDHPECLMGDPSQHGVFRKWSAVDYDNAIVRDAAVAFVEEVCRQYDIDGVELDFFRHPVLFKATALGRAVGDEQRAKMTELVRRIRAMMDEEGRRRGRPYVLAVRTPDDPDYALTIGLDIEAWMREGWVDCYIPSGYVRLRSWRDSIELGRRYGVKVYPGLSETRVGGGHHGHPLRASDEAYRARAANAWQAGADGLYLFNLFDPHRKIWRELGDPDALKRLDKVYFASFRGARRIPGGSYAFKGFIQIPTLTPRNPLPLLPGHRQVVRVEVAEGGAPGAADQPAPAMVLSVQVGFDNRPETKPPDLRTVEEALQVVFNGRATVCREASDGWGRFPLDPAWVRPGWNSIEVVHDGQQEGWQLLDVMIGVDVSGNLLSDTAYLKTTRGNM